MTLDKLAQMVADGFQNVYERFNLVDERFDGVDDKLQDIDKTIFDLHNRDAIAEKEIGRLKRQVDKLQGKLSPKS